MLAIAKAETQWAYPITSCPCRTSPGRSERRVTAPAGDDARNQRQRKLVVSGGYWGVRREYAKRLDRLDGFSADRRLTALPRFLVGELHGEQARVPCVHVKAAHVAVSQRAASAPLQCQG